MNASEEFLNSLSEIPRRLTASEPPVATSSERISAVTASGGLRESARKYLLGDPPDGLRHLGGLNFGRFPFIFCLGDAC